MWLARCWGQAVSSVAELEVVGGLGRGVRNSEEAEREREGERVGPDRAREQSQRPGISGIA